MTLKCKHMHLSIIIESTPAPSSMLLTYHLICHYSNWLLGGIFLFYHFKYLLLGINNPMEGNIHWNQLPFNIVLKTDIHADTNKNKKRIKIHNFKPPRRRPGYERYIFGKCNRINLMKITLLWDILFGRNGCVAGGCIDLTCLTYKRQAEHWQTSKKVPLWFCVFLGLTDMCVQYILRTEDDTRSNL